MPRRVYAVTINVTRAFVVNTDTELNMTVNDPQSERGSSADWDKLNQAVFNDALAFVDDVLENIVAVEIDPDSEYDALAALSVEPAVDNRSDDPLE